MEVVRYDGEIRGLISKNKQPSNTKPKRKIFFFLFYFFFKFPSRIGWHLAIGTEQLDTRKRQVGWFEYFDFQV